MEIYGIQQIFYCGLTVSSANLITVTIYSRFYEKVFLEKVDIENDDLLHAAAILIIKTFIDLVTND